MAATCSLALESVSLKDHTLRRNCVHGYPVVVHVLTHPVVIESLLTFLVVTIPDPVVTVFKVTCPEVAIPVVTVPVVPNLVDHVVVHVVTHPVVTVSRVMVYFHTR